MCRASGIDPPGSSVARAGTLGTVTGVGAAKGYLKPGGLLWGKAAAEAARAGLAGAIAGGEVGFATVEVITRDGPAMTREWRAFADLARSGEAWIRERLDGIAAPRAPVAGLDLSGPCLMGIVNVTPDSFSDGGRHADGAGAIAHGLALAGAGAAILDIGGESTRPYSRPTPEAEEQARILPVVEALSRAGHIVSIDTRKPAIMRAAVAAGAAMVNDVSALGYAPDSIAVARALGMPVALMHARGDPATMQDDPRYDDVALDVFDWLEERLAACVSAGIPEARILLDPGIGFGKTHAHNLELLGSLALLHGLGRPLLVGASRKGFVGKLTGEPEAGRRVTGSIGAAVAAAMQGAQIIRVHDVAETRQALAVWHAATVTQSMELDGRFTRSVLGSNGP